MTTNPSPGQRAGDSTPESIRMRFRRPITILTIITLAGAAAACHDALPSPAQIFDAVTLAAPLGDRPLLGIGTGTPVDHTSRVQLP